MDGHGLTAGFMFPPLLAAKLLPLFDSLLVATFGASCVWLDVGMLS